MSIIMNEFNGFLDQISGLHELTLRSTRRVNTMNNWKKVLTFAFAMSIAVNLAAFDGGRSDEQEKKPTPATKIDSPKEMAATSVELRRGLRGGHDGQRHDSSQGLPEVSA